MVSMAVAGRTVLLSATQGEDFPVPAEMNVCVDRTVLLYPCALGLWLYSCSPNPRQ